MAKYQAVGVPKIHSYFTTSGGVLTFYKDNASTQIAIGVDDAGIDFKLFGDTSGKYVLWDESADLLDINASVTASGTVSFAGAVGFSTSVALAGPVSMTGSSIYIADAGDKLGFFGEAVTTRPAKVASTGVASDMAQQILNGLEALGLFAST